MIITIDGPAGAGKSTVARKLAERLGFEFLDTGAMYRAVAWACIHDRVNLQNAEEVGRTAASLTLQVSPERILCNQYDVTCDIRKPEVSAAASIVAAVPAVREEMVRLQRETADGRKIVTEGRDQGTVVFPHAECKFFLTADPRERAMRRMKELERTGQAASFEEVLAQIVDRDERDRSRAIAPLVPAVDAIEVDTSGRAIDEILDQMESIAHSRGQSIGS